MRSLRSRDIRHERIGVITSDSGGLGGLKRQLYLEMQNILSLRYTDPYQANLASLGIDYSHLLARAPANPIFKRLKNTGKPRYFATG